MYLLGVFLYLFSNCTSDKAENERSNSTDALDPVIVRTLRLEKSNFQFIIRRTGKVQSFTDLLVKSSTTGQIKRLYIKNGDWVQRGMVLAELENNKESLALEKAQLLLQEKRINFEDQMLGQKKGHDSTRLVEVTNNIRLTSGLALAELSLKEAKSNFEKTFLYSSNNGRVSDLNVAIGSLISSDETFCRIYDSDKLIVICEVLETDALKLTNSVRAEIYTLNQQKVRGQILEVNPRVNEETNLVKIKISILTQAQLFPGMTVSVSIMLPQNKAITVPKEAVVIRSGRQIVFIAENGFAKWKDVELGHDNGEDVAVLTGLKEGDSVIVSNNLQLVHDSRVRIIN